MTPLKLAEQLTVAAEVARLRASQATTVVDQVRGALDSRKVTAQAIGMLMHQYTLTEDAALEVLRRRAFSANVTVHELAEEMIEAADRSGLALPPTADC